MSENGKGVTLLELKQFFIKKNATVKEAKETVYRFLDSIESNYPNLEERDCLFNGGNGYNVERGMKNRNGYKQPMPIIVKELSHADRPRYN